MTGITSFGGYVPWLFLERKTIFGAMGWFNPATFGVARGQKAVANHDEDTLSHAAPPMPAAAPVARNVRRLKIDRVLVADTHVQSEGRDKERSIGSQPIRRSGRPRGSSDPRAKHGTRESRR